MRRFNISSLGLAFPGLLIGGFIGFLSRPSGALTGKLPFIHVITRGATYEGLDQVLISLAQQSFNVMLSGAIIGAAVGILLGFFIIRK